MKNHHYLLNWISIAALASLIMFSLAACQHSRQLQVAPIAGRDVVALDAEDVVAIMQRAGLNDSEIIDLGTELRNSLSSRGAARITSNGKTVALLTVLSPYVYISTMEQGNFIYNSKTGQFQR